MLSNQEIRSRLALIKQVWTPAKNERFLNEIVDVDERGVKVKSAATNNLNDISYDQIRNGSRDRSSLVASLRKILGIRDDNGSRLQPSTFQTPLAGVNKASVCATPSG